MNCELEKIMKKRVWPKFEALFWNLPGGAEENNKTPVWITGLWAEI
jgi:hypothetical protein